MLRINDEAPNFTAETSQGTINFHDWIGNGWAILFSHPKDFTPVCTTELGYMAGLQPEFEKRDCKIIGLSVDPVSSHSKWLVDIEETQGHKVNYPMIGDTRAEGRPALRHAARRSRRHLRRPHRRHQRHRAHRLRRRAGQEDQAHAQLPHEHRPQLRRECCASLDSLQLTAKEQVSTPVNWKPGDDVIIAGSVSDEDAKKKYPQGWKSPKPYLRLVSLEKEAGARGGEVIFKQFYLPCLAHASYLIGDEATGTAAVVDPQRDTDQYIAFAAEHGLKIKHVFLTHLHADFIAGHLELRDRVGATIYLGATAKAGYAFTALGDGDILEFGRIRLKALETPGHTPESISIVVYDLDASDAQPYAVLTGDTLFIGDVGRPDLRVALGWSATDLGGMLFDSLHQKLLSLPDQSLVYPAHGAGSLCGRAHQQGNSIDHGRTAAIELCAAAHEQGSIHPTW